MKDTELKKLKDDLWHSADVLRAGAHLAANKYGQPILGLIFLRYADILYKQHKDEIEAEYNKHKGGRTEKSIKDIAIEKCGFFLPECAYFDYINNAPDDANKAVIVKKAMEAIEDENPKMMGVLPKEVYAQLVPEEEPELLSNIIRIFKDIPENCTVDIFGEIYEYFLGNFALAEGKDGGTFYTPATVVRYMVEVLDPQPGDKKFLEQALQQMINKNCTRIKFSQRYRGIIDRYNAGGSENEDYYEQLVKLIEDLKDEDKRANVEGLSEEELEIYDLLVAGKRLSQADEQKVKLSAKNLFKKLSENKREYLVVDWYKDDQPRAIVKNLVESSLNDDLPICYDKESFQSKIDLLMNHFVDMAVQGYGWIGTVA